MSSIMPSILLIYTGGTIGMVRDNLLGSLRPLPFNRLLDEIPELGRFECKIFSHTFDPPIDSSNINTEEWVKIAAIIERSYEKYDAFVILHGTDTMAYSASAISFMLENLAKPVIFTGSQLPIGSLRTDAKENLISAIEIAIARKKGLPVVPEVCIFFQNKLFRGNRTSKYNSEEFKAFQSYNYPPLAEIGVHIRYNKNLIHTPEPTARFRVGYKLNCNVVILKIFPGITKKTVHSILNIPELEGVVLETYGAGNAPSAGWFLDEIKEAIQKSIFILNVTQCAEGSVEMGMYETSFELGNTGVINGKDITTEAAITKLMYCLGRNISREEIIMDLNRPIRGEITL